MKIPRGKIILLADNLAAANIEALRAMHRDLFAAMQESNAPLEEEEAEKYATEIIAMARRIIHKNALRFVRTEGAA